MSTNNRGPRRRYWVFTLNNPGNRKKKWIGLPACLSYLVYQCEKGKEGTIHLQGYLELKTPQYMGYLKKHFSGKAHFDIRRGSQAQAIAYCTKLDTRILGEGPWEYGEKALGQGARIDLIDFRKDITGGMSLLNLWEHHTLEMAKYPKMFDSLLMLSHVPSFNLNKSVLIIYGDPGTGKTRSVYAKWVKEVQPFYRWPAPNTCPWFDGYFGQEKALFDDFAGKRSHMSLVMLLQMLDIYDCVLPVKGGHVWWTASSIVITTNIHPRDWYDWKDREVQYLALKRRVTEVWQMIKHEHEDWIPIIVTNSFWYDAVLDPPPRFTLLTDEVLESGELTDDELLNDAVMWDLGTPMWGSQNKV